MSRSGFGTVALLGLALGLMPVGAGAQSPWAYPSPEIEYREPHVVWAQLLWARDEMHRLTEAEELEEVVALARLVTGLRRELYADVQFHLGITTPEEERDPEKKPARAAMIRSKRAIYFLSQFGGDVRAAASTGIPGNVRVALSDLDRHLAFIETTLTDACGPDFLTGPASDGEDSEASGGS